MIFRNACYVTINHYLATVGTPLLQHLLPGSPTTPMTIDRLFFSGRGLRFWTGCLNPGHWRVYSSCGTYCRGPCLLLIRGLAVAERQHVPPEVSSVYGTEEPTSRDSLAWIVCRVLPDGVVGCA